MKNYERIGCNYDLNAIEEENFGDENAGGNTSLENILNDQSLSFKSYQADENEFESEKKKRRKRTKKHKLEKKELSTRKNVNQPATQPFIRMMNGEEKLIFKYNTKISEHALSSMPRSDLEENEFCVNFYLDGVTISDLDEKFKLDNCIYPRANVPKEKYRGNRWEYENECNQLAWRFVKLNRELLYARKGLIQRAVDSYRNIYKHTKNKKSFSEGWVSNSNIKKRIPDSVPATVSILYTVKGITRKINVRIDIENVNFEKIEDTFKSAYLIFPEDFDENSFGQNRWSIKNDDNVIAIKIAFLNADNTVLWNAVKVTDKKTILKKAVEAYKKRLFEIEKNTDEQIEEPIKENSVSNLVSEMLTETNKDPQVQESFNFIRFNEK